MQCTGMPGLRSPSNPQVGLPDSTVHTGRGGSEISLLASLWTIAHTSDQPACLTVYDAGTLKANRTTSVIISEQSDSGPVQVVTICLRIAQYCCDAHMFE